MGRLTTQTYCLPDNCGNRQTVTAQYDLAGHMTNLTYPDGRQVAQLWDPAGRLSSVNSVTAITGGPIFNGPAGVNVALSPYWTANSYFPDGSLNSVAYGNGANELRWENSRSQTCELSMFMPPAVGGTQMFDHQYFFGQAGGGTACAPTAGNNGNISQIVDNTNPTAGSNTRNQTFGYDSLNRLTSWSTASMSGSPRGQAYSYDSFGNISQTNGVNMPNVSPGYDANNHMQGLSCGSNIYDLAGNVLCQGMWGIDAQSYSYDAESRVWQVQAQSMGTQFNIVARARYYASNMGRWVSPDWASNPQAIPYASYADPQSLNLYNYMRNNPLGGVDADGHLPDWLKDLGIGFAKGFGKAVSPLGNGLNYLHNISHPSSGQLPTNMGYSYDNSTQAIGGAFSTGLMVVAGEALSMPGYGGSTTVTASAPAALATESVPTTALLEGLANDAVQNVGPGSGAAYGTVVHSEFSDLVEALGNPNLFTEQSYLNGQPVSYGTPGSIRIDVGEGTINAPTGVYDLKTGSATLTPKRVEQIQSHLPNGSNVPVTEIRPPQ
jgi:RHS repeat-associated protein